MAEALARELAGDVIEPSSAGISPYGSIVQSTRKILLERGIPLDGQRSKGLGEAGPLFADLVINMTGIPGLALFPDSRVEDWNVTDPYGDELGAYREVCDEIEARVKELGARLRTGRGSRS